jgi:hypothetical protein
MWRQSFIIPFFLFTNASFVACEKDPAMTKKESAIKADAGFDQTVLLPSTSTLLSAINSAYDPAQVKSLRWNLVSGDPMVKIESPDQKMTRVSNLKAGHYLFSFTITSADQQATSDSIQLVVIAPVYLPNAVQIDGLVWNCTWGCALSVGNIPEILPPGTSLVHVSYRDNSGQLWKVIPPAPPATAATAPMRRFLENNFLTIVSSREWKDKSIGMVLLEFQ